MYPGDAPTGTGSPSTVGTAMLAAGGALADVGFVVALPALDDEVPDAAGSWSRGHSSAVSPPATARITSSAARSSQRCRRRSAAGSGPPREGSGPLGPLGSNGVGGG